MLNDRVGGVQNVLGGAVILLQPDHTGVRIALVKTQDIFDVRPPEAVNGLVVVAHHAEIPPPARQQGDQQVLQVACVLILVHQHIVKLVLIVLQDLRFLFEQRDGIKNQIVKIQRVGGVQLLFVGGVDFGNADHTPAAHSLANASGSR